MPRGREAGDLTKALRQLFDETNGEITYNDARERLPKMGFPVAAKPDRSSVADYEQWKQYEVDYDDPASIKAVADTLGFDKARTDACVARALYDKEVNNFNVTKYNWAKAKESGKVTTSRKPAAAQNTKSRTAAKKRGRPKKTETEAEKPKKRGRARKAELVVGTVDDALTYIEKHGGLQKCEARLDAARAKVEKLQEQLVKAQGVITELEGHVSTVVALQKRVTRAA